MERATHDTQESKRKALERMATDQQNMVYSMKDIERLEIVIRHLEEGYDFMNDRIGLLCKRVRNLETKER